MHEQLHGRQRQPDPRRLHARVHLDVDEEVLVQLVGGRRSPAPAGRGGGCRRPARPAARCAAASLTLCIVSRHAASSIRARSVVADVARPGRRPGRGDRPRDEVGRRLQRVADEVERARRRGAGWPASPRSASVSPNCASTAVRSASAHSITPASTSLPCGVARAGLAEHAEERVGLGLVVALQRGEPQQPREPRPTAPATSAGAIVRRRRARPHARRLRFGRAEVRELAGGEPERLAASSTALRTRSSERAPAPASARVVDPGRRDVGLGDRRSVRQRSVPTRPPAGPARVSVER